jgi:hypothetical protein
VLVVLEDMLNAKEDSREARASERASTSKDLEGKPYEWDVVRFTRSYLRDCTHFDPDDYGDFIDNSSITLRDMQPKSEDWQRWRPEPGQMNAVQNFRRRWVVSYGPQQAVGGDSDDDVCMMKHVKTPKQYIVEKGGHSEDEGLQMGDGIYYPDTDEEEERKRRLRKKRKQSEMAQDPQSPPHFLSSYAGGFGAGAGVPAGSDDGASDAAAGSDVQSQLAAATAAAAAAPSDSAGSVDDPMNDPAWVAAAMDDADAHLAGDDALMDE